MKKIMLAVACVALLGTQTAFQEQAVPLSINIEEENEEDEVYEVRAESESLTLLASSKGNIALRTDSGFTWSGEADDPVLLRYGIPSKRSTTLLRSSDCTASVSDIQGGIRITYDFPAGFRFPVDVTLEDDHLRARVDMSEFEETTPDRIATELTLFGGFGAACEEGDCFVVPDGSGALIRFTDRTDDSSPYSRQIYGSDITAVPTTRPNPAEQILFPMFGIIKGGDSLLAVASEGDANASISAKASQSAITCGFTFTLRTTDTFYMSGNSTDRFTVFESGEIRSGDIELLFFPLNKKNAGFTDIAEKYRQYLNITPRDDSPSLFVNVYGGAEVKKNLFGIPVTSKLAATTFPQTKELLSEFTNKGVDSITATLHNWSDSGIENKIDTSASPSSTLGGRQAFRQLSEYAQENDISLCMAFDNMAFRSGNGYNSINGTCIRASGSYSRLVSYDNAFGIPDGFSKTMSLLSPEYFDDVYNKISSCGLSCIMPLHLTDALYGDYSKKKLTRNDSLELTTSALQTLSESSSLIAETANAYALPYVSGLANIPTESSRFDIFSEDVPLVQAILHGVVPYATVVNSSPSPTDTLLRAVSVGCLPCYDMVGVPTVKLKDTELDTLFYADYNSWIDEAAEVYTSLKPLYEAIQGATITGYTTDGSITTTSYSNGTITETDTERQSIKMNGEIIYER